jgi:hypothetical protein
VPGREPSHCAKCKKRGWNTKAGEGRVAKVERKVTEERCPVEMLGRVVAVKETRIEYGGEYTQED